MREPPQHYANLHRTTRQQDPRSPVLLRPGSAHRNAPGPLSCRRDSALSGRPGDSSVRLPAIRRAVPRGAPHPRGAAGGSARPDDRLIRHRTFRKEDRITQRLADRGDHPDLVHIFSAMESVGSTITQQLLLEYPQRVNKAIIFATSPGGRAVALTAKGKTPDDPSVLRQTEATIHWKTPWTNCPSSPIRL